MFCVHPCLFCILLVAFSLLSKAISIFPYSYYIRIMILLYYEVVFSNLDFKGGASAQRHAVLRKVKARPLPLIIEHQQSTSNSGCQRQSESVILDSWSELGVHVGCWKSVLVLIRWSGMTVLSHWHFKFSVVWIAQDLFQVASDGVTMRLSLPVVARQFHKVTMQPYGAFLIAWQMFLLWHVSSIRHNCWLIFLGTARTGATSFLVNSTEYWGDEKFYKYDHQLWWGICFDALVHHEHKAWRSRIIERKGVLIKNDVKCIFTSNSLGLSEMP
jgi:hypothetical protein